VVVNNVTIIGNSNLASMQASDASKMYGKNIFNFLKLIIDKDGQINLNFEDDLVKGTCITHDGQIVNERTAQLVN
jgi:NAD(P) transhydrogenase subunit alpha